MTDALIESDIDHATRARAVRTVNLQIILIHAPDVIFLDLVWLTFP